jgi:pimeloyl-ACP methyl ester carboxylesterase
MVKATNHHPAVGPLRQVDAGLLNVGYAEVGPADGRVAVLLHGWPYDTHSYLEVAPLLAAAGYRVVVPYLRGFGTTRFRSDERFRWRLDLADGEPDYQELEEQLAHGPVIGVPTITLEGDANGAPHPDPSSYASKFAGPSSHRTIEGGIGHNLPQEAPEAFANAVIEADPS